MTGAMTLLCFTFSFSEVGSCLVAPGFWLGGWWMIPCLLALAWAALAGFVRWRLRRVLRENARLEALAARQNEGLDALRRELQEAKKAMENLSLVDPLTDCYNRRYMQRAMKEEFARQSRLLHDKDKNPDAGCQSMVLLLMDLDRMARINERFGHGVGDEVIRQSARALRSAARETDTLFRLEGATFLLLARGCSGRDASIIAERIQSGMASATVSGPEEAVRWTCSMGFAVFPFLEEHPDFLTWEQVLEVADACLSLAKDSGRDRWVGVQARPGLDPARHGPALPWDMAALVRLGVLEAFSNTPNPFSSQKSFWKGMD